jgi:alanine racemase
MCNSAATVGRPADRFDGVRVGILLYGVCPSDCFDLPLRPVLKLKTVISHLHEVSPGETVGYGGIYRADSHRTIATVPIGYADGFLRGYSGCRATVETSRGDRSAPIVGNVCMDQCMIDVTDTGARVGDTVTFFGNHTSELAAYAHRARSIGYECLCLISSRVPRIYHSEKETFDEQ